MGYRDPLLFATTGWDPTWQRQLSPRARAVWATFVSLLSAYFFAAGFLAWLYMPPAERWKPFVLAGLWLCTVGVVQVLVRREVLRRVDVEADQIAARQIQMRLLPDELPTSARFDVAARYAPFREIGGDYYDVSPLGGGRWLLVMADVAGKGTGAALLTASLQGLVHFAQANEPSIEAATAAINRHLVRFAPAGRFITLVLAILDLEQRRLRYVNAGHNPPLGLTASGEPLRLEATGPPVGLFEAAVYAAGEIELPAGAVCLFYTDGLAERANSADQFFGEERILESLRQGTGEASAAEVLATVGRAVDTFAGGVEPTDDVALLVLRGR